MDAPGRAVAAARGDGEARPAVAPHRHTKTRQQVERDVNVGLGDQFAHHLNHDVLAADQGQGQEQGGEELAGDVASHANGRIQLQGRRRTSTDLQRRVARLAEVGDGAAQGQQAVDQIADGALVHARHATEGELAAQLGAEQGQGRGERSHGGARVAQEQIGLAHRQLGAQALHAQAAVGLKLDGAAQLPQGLEHHTSVVRVQQVDDLGLALAQSREQEHTVGNAFGAGQANRATGVGQGGEIEEFGGEHGWGQSWLEPWPKRHWPRAALAVAMSSRKAGASSAMRAASKAFKACW